MSPRQETVNSLTPRLPYRCREPGCDCRRRRTDLTSYTVHVHRGTDNFIATIRDEEENMVDVLLDRDLSTLVGAVHRNYPFAKGKGQT